MSPFRLLAFGVLLFCSSLNAATPREVLLWPDGAPGAVGESEKDKPRIYIHSASGPNRTNTAVVICPGGGYGVVVKSYEGHEVAEWFNSIGVTAIVLDYRIAPRYGHPAPKQDVERAIRYVKSQADALDIDPDRVGVMGFSAGGHLAATASTLFSEGNAESTDAIERQSSRPAFSILAYPVITMGEFTHRGSRRNLLGDSPTPEMLARMSLEQQVGKNTPPAFVFHTSTDRAVPAQNAVLYYSALLAAGVPAEIHIYREGPHGVGLGRHIVSASWPGQLKLWLTHLSLLDKAKPKVAKWIWIDREEKDSDKVYFRRVVDLTGKVTKAELVASCDNGMRVFLNGKKVLESTSWESPVRADVKSVLADGLNLIAVEGSNQSGPAGLIAQLEVTVDGTKRVYVTDKFWEASRERQAGWRKIQFEPEGWGAVAELGDLGSGTWAAVNAGTLAAAATPRKVEATPVDAIKVLPGFKVERLYTVPKGAMGSWVSMTVDPKGRLIVGDQYGSLYRFMPPAPGKELSDEDIERIDLDIGGAHGLLYAFDSLYVVRGEGNQGLYRLRDTDGDDKYDEVKLLRKLKGGGEHGPHSVILSPDGKSLYINGGNHTDLPDPEKSVVPRVWKEDHILPRQWDATGHARGKMAPGGWIARTDPDGKEWELVSIGYRNQFDIAFNVEGDLFTYDADMEWDVGLPWYRPTRVNHATSGSEFGWRSGTGKWPEYYVDSLDSVVDVGPGSPTGIVFGYGANFPEKYQRALYICDWSYGKLYAVHLVPHGSTWKAEKEQFMAASPLPLTDLQVHPKDGSLYVAIGGRRTQSGLYRITHTGEHRAKKLEPIVTPEAKIRRDLEKLHVGNHKNAVKKAWPYLGHSDRYVRFAARVAIELRPTSEWVEKALDDDLPMIEALVAVARMGEKSLQPQLLAALARIDLSKATRFNRLAVLRAYQLCFVRMGRPSDALVKSVGGRLMPHYPVAGDFDMNRELSRLLVYLETEGVAKKTVDLLRTTPTQEEQIHYALVLRNLVGDWDVEQRERYFDWFNYAAGFHGGHSFAGFIRNIKSEAVAKLSEEQKKAFAKVLAPRPVENPLADIPKPKGPGKEWSVDDLAGKAASLRGRNFQNGKNMFAAGSCFNCHRFDGRGGATGPDLTGVGGRFSARDLLESIVEPSKTVSDQYQATTFVMRDGTAVVGRIVNASGDSLMVNTDMLKPGQHRRIARNQILQISPSKTSVMPEALINTMNQDEVLDLLAYLLSRGDANHSAFK